MNVEELYKTGGIVVPNPLYDKKKKKNPQPPTTLETNLAKVQNPLANQFYESNPELGFTFKGDFEKYTDYGINPNRISKDLDIELSNAQSRVKKFANGIVQAVVSEVGLGTLKSFSDIIDASVLQWFSESNDYSNPVSQALSDAQEAVKKEFAVYSDPSKNIFNGGLLSAGWWASNLPSVASTLMLLLPTKGISFAAGKAASAITATKFGAKAAKTGTQIARNIINSQRTRQTISSMAKYGAEGSLMRLMENYQESNQVYNDMLPKAIESLNQLNDEDYATYIQAHKNELGDDIDLTDRNAVAKRIASKAATTTFWDDAFNGIFDAYQLYGLSNVGRTIMNANRNAKITRLSKLQAKNPNKTSEELQALLDARPKYKKILNTITDTAKGGSTLALSEMSEGVEEAVNYIAQQEGMHYGDYLLGKANNTSMWSSRIKNYMAAPELWDSAFWGVMGGVIFGAAGSKLNEISGKRQAKKRVEELKALGMSEEQIPDWMKTGELPEMINRKRELDARAYRWNSLIENLNSIKSKKDPITGAELTTNEEIEQARQRAINSYTTDLMMSAIDCGHWKLTKDFLQSDDLINAMVDNGVLSKEEAQNRAQQVREQADYIDKLYNKNLKTVENALTAAAKKNKDLENIPPEIFQMIVKSNMKNQINADNLEREINRVSDSITEEEDRVRQDLDKQGINFDTFIKTRIYSESLGQINAEIRKLENSKEASTTAGQHYLNVLRKRKEVVNQKLQDSWQELQLEDRLATILTSRRISSLLDIRTNGQNQEEYFFNTDTEDFQKLLNAVATKDTKTLNELLGTTEVTDENIERVLQKYKVQDESYNTLYGTSENKEFASLNDFSHKLYEDYHVRAAMQVQQILELSEIATTADDVLNQVDYFNNEANAARKAGIDYAMNAIQTLARKYGTEEVAAYVDGIRRNENTGLYDRLTEQEKKVMDDIIPALGLSKVLNTGLYERIQQALKNNKIWEYSEENDPFKEVENSTTNQNQPQSSQTSQSNNSSRTTPQTDTGQGNAPISNQPQINKLPSGTKIQIGYDADNNTLTFTPVAPDTSGTNIVDINQDDDGTIWLRIRKPEDVEAAFLSERQLFTGFDPNKSNPSIESSPAIIEENGAYVVKTQGTITYASNSSTGGSESLDDDTDNDKDQVEEIDLNSIMDDFKQQMATSGGTFKWSDFENAVKAKYATASPRQIDEHLTEIKLFITENGFLNADTGEVNAPTITSLSIYADEYFKAATDEARKKTKEEAKDVFKELMKEYVNERAVDVVNGKTILSLEDLLRWCNTKTDDNSRAGQLYDILIDLLNESGNYVLVDITNTKKDKNRILANAAKRIENRKDELLNGASKPTSLAVARYVKRIRKEIEDAKKNNNSAAQRNAEKELEKVTSVIRGLKTTDKLIVKKQGRVKSGVRTGIDFIVDTPNGPVKIGEIPLPERTGNGFTEINDGWITDVPVVQGVESVCKGFFKRCLTPKAQDKEGLAILNKLESILVGNTKLTNAEADDIINNYIVPLLAKSNISLNDISSARVSNLVKVNGLLKLLKWVKTYGNLMVSGQTSNVVEKLATEQVNRARETSLDVWFEKLEQSYSNAEMVAQAAAKNLPINIGSISDGGPIYSDPTRISEALASDEGNGGPAVFGIVSMTDGNVISMANGEQIPNELGAKRGTPFMIIPGQHGTKAYVHVTPLPLSSSIHDSHDEIKTIINEALNLITKTIDEWTTDKSSDDLRRIFQNLFDSKRGLFRGFSIEPLTRGNAGFQLIYSDNDGINRIEFFDKVNLKNGGTENVSNVRFNLAKLRKQKKPIRGVPIHKNVDKTLAAAKTQAINMLKDIIKNNCSFNITYNSINKIPYANNTYHGNVGGNFVIEIPGGEKHTFNSFNDFIKENELVLVNTRKNETGDSNYYNPGESADPTNDPIVTYTFNTNPPVEESTASAQPAVDNRTTLEKVTDTLSQTSGSPVLDAVKHLLSTDAFNTISASEIFNRLQAPVMYIENINEYDELDKEGNPKPHPDFIGAAHKEEVKYKHKTTGNIITIPKGTIVMSSRWGNMVNGNLNNRFEAFRQLTHEQLHIALLNNPNREKLLEEAGKIRDELLAYQFDDDADKALQDIIRNLADVEEFLVESITRPAIIDLLNRTESSTKVKGSTTSRKKSNLLEKVLDVICKILNININKGNLLHKELMMLKKFGEDKAIKEIAKNIKNINDTTETNNEVVVEESNDNNSETENVTNDSNEGLNADEDEIEDDDEDTDSNSYSDERMEDIDEDDIGFSLLDDAAFVTSRSITEPLSDEEKQFYNKFVNSGNMNIHCSL